MELKIKFLKWSAGAPVAMLNEKTAKKVGAHTPGRISIRTISKKPKEMSTVVDIVEGLVKENEIAVSSEIRKRMNLKAGQKVIVGLSSPPEALNLIKKKLNNKKLSEKELDKIIEEVVDNSLSTPEIALLVSAMYKQGMTTKETVYLIKAILKNGNTLNFKNKFVIDKHSIGGIPGNRTTPLVVSICAAIGLLFPKNSSRAITSAAGTVDVIETMANVEFSASELKKIIRKTNACLVWGGALGVVPADSKILQIEKMLKLDVESQLLASIMSKKLAVDSNYILIDIPYGKTAKATKKRALRLKRKFENLGRYFHKKLKVVLTKGDQPIGNGIGPELEMRDIIRILDPKQNSPKDLEEKSLFLAGELLEMVGKAKPNKGIEMAKQILDSGQAFKKFNQIIKAQGGKLRPMKEAKLKKNILAKRSGKIVEMHNKKINHLAKIAGCPTDKSAGLYLYKHLRERVKKGDKILTIYADSKTRLNQAIKFYNTKKPIKIK